MVVAESTDALTSRADLLAEVATHLGIDRVDLVDAGHLDSEEVRSLRILARLGLRAGDVVERIVAAYPNAPSNHEGFVALLDAVGATLPNGVRLRRERLAMGKPGEWLTPPSCRPLTSRIGCRARPPEELLPRLRLAHGRMGVWPFFLVGPDSTSAQLVAALE